MITKFAAVVGAIGVIATTSYAGYSYTQTAARETFGAWPWASKETVEMIAQQTSYEVSVRQTSIQFEINRLRDKCARNCTQYEGKALQNYIDEWQRNQRYIDAMRANTARQQAMPMATVR